LLMPTSVRVASVAAIAITRASKGQGMVPSHHCLPCHCRCHCCHHRCCYCLGKIGTGDDAAASLPALSPLLMPTSVRIATVAAIAITRASKGQGMVPRHHCLPCHCRRCAGKQGAGYDVASSLSALSAAAVAIARQARDTMLVTATAAALFVTTAAATLPLHSDHSSHVTRCQTLPSCH
jgi:hypothetical protein